MYTLDVAYNRDPVTEILGILNVTRDSFSDGGRYLDPDAAVEHGLALAADGADLVDVGAASSHPDSEDVPAAEELRRLTPVVGPLVAAGVRVSVDTWRPPVAARMVELGAELVNDITGLADPAMLELGARTDVRFIVMHSTSAAARAERGAAPAAIVDRIAGFFEERARAAVAAGIDRSRLVLDPGMGFFLGRTPEASLEVLRELERLGEPGLPLCVSTSRKSFLGELVGRPVAEREAATLASELWAWTRGVAMIRTHGVRALRDGLRVMEAIRGPAFERRPG